MLSVTDSVDGGLQVTPDDLTQLHWVGIALATVTGVIHFVLAAVSIPEGVGIAFLVAGFGYFGGIAAILLDYRRETFVLLGIPFTLGQVAAWYVLNATDLSALGIADKVVQVLLIVVLILLSQEN